ncbi:MAG: hypothetical protein ABIC95_00675 [archaeon]
MTSRGSIRGRQGIARNVILPFLVLLIILGTVVPIVFADKEYDYVLVANTKDWRELYLAAFYAGINNAELIYFKTLGEAQIKSGQLDEDEEIVILEPEKNAVVKNYESFLEVNGYQDFYTIDYESLQDLQEILWDDAKADGYLVLYPEFGVEAASATAYALEQNLIPLFMDEYNIGEVKKIIKGSDNVIFLGHFPIRLLDDMTGEFITDHADKNAKAITSRYLEDYDGAWAIITRIDRIDPYTLTQGPPLLVYTGSTEDIADLIKDSSITNVEIIGADTVAIAQEAEIISGKDLRLVLKYARTVTNLPGMGGKLLDLDTIKFDFPAVGLEIVDTVYYPSLNVLAITFRSTGNVPTRFFSQVEFGGEALSDDNIHSVPPGETITIPYFLGSADDDTVRVVINTQYGIEPPLTERIKTTEGLPIILRNATSDSHIEQSTIEMRSVGYDDGQGILFLELFNPTDAPMQVFAEIIFAPGDVLASGLITIPSLESGIAQIPTPYRRGDSIIDNNYRINVFHGEKDTLFMTNFSMAVSQRVSEPLIVGNVIALGPTSITIFAVVLLIVLFLILAARRRRRKEEG